MLTVVEEVLSLMTSPFHANTDGSIVAMVLVVVEEEDKVQHGVGLDGASWNACGGAGTSMNHNDRSSDLIWNSLRHFFLITPLPSGSNF